MAPRLFTRFKRLFKKNQQEDSFFFVSTESEVFVDAPPYHYDPSTPSAPASHAHAPAARSDATERAGAEALHAFFNPARMDPDPVAQLSQRATGPHSTQRASPSGRLTSYPPPGIPFPEDGDGDQQDRDRNRDIERLRTILLAELGPTCNNTPQAPKSRRRIVHDSSFADEGNSGSSDADDEPLRQTRRSRKRRSMSIYSRDNRAIAPEYRSDRHPRQPHQPCHSRQLHPPPRSSGSPYSFPPLQPLDTTLHSQDDNGRGATLTDDSSTTIAALPTCLRKVHLKHVDTGEHISPISSQKFAGRREWAIRGLLDSVPLATVHVAQHRSGALHAIKSVCVRDGRDARRRVAELRVLRMLQERPHPFLLGPPLEAQGERFFWAGFNGFLNIVTLFCPYGHLGLWCGEVDGRQLLYLAAELVLAIEFLHDNSFAHTDIKPDNIFIDTNGHSYLAPEMIEARDLNTKDLHRGQYRLFSFDDSVDWWSFGVTLLEIWAGKTTYNPYQDDLIAQYLSFKDEGDNELETFTQEDFSSYIQNEVLPQVKEPTSELAAFVTSLLTVEPKARRDRQNSWKDHEYFAEIGREVGWPRIDGHHVAPFSWEWRRDHEVSVGYKYNEVSARHEEWPAMRLRSLFRAFEREQWALSVQERYDPADAHRPGWENTMMPRPLGLAHERTDDS
ncbi:hypothetical protein EW146_g2165 [Bondarzewia mesenterica]|uniref:Protein kinase domain-containing protein n=1 Tax=Bondarzewia mesenterica TaxID=1095465 RepID=A0A4S4M2X3_9AGAM|nr:hypothetical protein EW146_g2165 [Bondarzewia mesenterica]